MSTTEDTTSGSEDSTSEVAETNASDAGQEGEAADASAGNVIDVEEASSDEGEEELSIEVEEPEPTPLEAALEKITDLEEGKKANYDRFIRATADLENVRKRTRKEVKDARLDERGKVLRDMLPVIDNLERANSHAKESETEATKSILEGITLVIRQFQQALERHLVSRLEAVGMPFDPSVHEAVSQAPSADHPPGTVITALQTGYMMDGRLLRPALVVVSTAMPEPVVEESDTDEEKSDSEELSGEVAESTEPSESEADSEGEE